MYGCLDSAIEEEAAADNDTEAVAGAIPEFAAEPALSATDSELVSRTGESLMRRQAASPSSVAATPWAKMDAGIAITTSVANQNRRNMSSLLAEVATGATEFCGGSIDKRSFQSNCRWCLASRKVANGHSLEDRFVKKRASWE
jgi:hypothetical protein